MYCVVKTTNGKPEVMNPPHLKKSDAEEHMGECIVVFAEEKGVDPIRAFGDATGVTYVFDDETVRFKLFALVSC